MVKYKNELISSVLIAATLVFYFDSFIELFIEYKLIAILLFISLYYLSYKGYLGAKLLIAYLLVSELLRIVVNSFYYNNEIFFIGFTLLLFILLIILVFDIRKNVKNYLSAIDILLYIILLGVLSIIIYYFDCYGYYLRHLGDFTCRYSDMFVPNIVDGNYFQQHLFKLK